MSMTTHLEIGRKATFPKHGPCAKGGKMNVHPHPDQPVHKPRVLNKPFKPLEPWANQKREAWDKV